MGARGIKSPQIYDSRGTGEPIVYSYYYTLLLNFITDELMNSILFAKPIKQDAFITILILTTQHSWYLATAIIKENQFYLASGMKSEELANDPRYNSSH